MKLFAVMSLVQVAHFEDNLPRWMAVAESLQEGVNADGAEFRDATFECSRDLVARAGLLIDLELIPRHLFVLSSEPQR